MQNFKTVGNLQFNIKTTSKLNVTERYRVLNLFEHTRLITTAVREKCVSSDLLCEHISYRL